MTSPLGVLQEGIWSARVSKEREVDERVSVGMELEKEWRGRFDEKPRLDEKFPGHRLCCCFVPCCWGLERRKAECSNRWEWNSSYFTKAGLAPSVCRISPQLLAGFGPVCCGFMREIFSSLCFVCIFFPPAHRDKLQQGPKAPHEGRWPAPERTHRWGDINKTTPPGTPVVRGTARKGIGRKP